MTEKMTVAGAYAKISEHEQDCALRYSAITTQLVQLNDLSTAIKAGVKWVLGSLFTIALGLICWLSVQVYELNREAAQPKPVAARMQMDTPVARSAIQSVVAQQKQWPDPA